jgi:two pore calcium channel protein
MADQLREPLRKSWRPSDEDPERLKRICKAEWVLENALHNRVPPEYPEDLVQAREDHRYLLFLQQSYKIAILGLVILTLIEVPPWCHGLSKDDWTFRPGSEWCPAPGHIPNGSMYISNIWYLPPGYAVIVELLIEAVIFTRWNKELRLEDTHFGPLGVEYGSRRSMHLGRLFAVGSIIDTVVFMWFRQPFRFTWLFRSGLLFLMPSVQHIFWNIFSRTVLMEFFSVGVFMIGAMVFFAWIAVTLFMVSDKVAFVEEEEIVSANKGMDKFSSALYTMFVAGVSGEFIDCFLPSFTVYKSSGILWMIYLVLTQVLLKNLVMDTLITAYLHSSKQELDHESGVLASGVLEAYRLLANGKTEISQSDFLDFQKELTRSPLGSHMPHQMIEKFYEHYKPITKEKFLDVCEVLRNDFTVTPRNSWLNLENSPQWSWVSKMVWEPADKPRFDEIMNQVLLVNLVLVVWESYYNICDGVTEPAWMDYIDLVFSFLYVGEVAVKLSVKSFAEYWKSGANQFDFWTTWLLLATSLLPYLSAYDGLDLSRYANILRLLRLVRILKKLKQLEKVQLMILVVTRIVNAAGEILGLMAVSFFFFASLSVNLFGGLIYEGNPQLEGTEYAGKFWYVLNFNDMPAALAAWFMQILLEYVPLYAEAIEKVSPHGDIAWIIVPFFYITTAAIMYELLIAFTVDIFISVKDEVETKCLDESEEGSDSSEFEEKKPKMGGSASESELTAALYRAETFEEKKPKQGGLSALSNWGGAAFKPSDKSAGCGSESWQADEQGIQKGRSFKGSRDVDPEEKAKKEDVDLPHSARRKEAKKEDGRMLGGLFQALGCVGRDDDGESDDGVLDVPPPPEKKPPTTAGVSAAHEETGHGDGHGHGHEHEHELPEPEDVLKEIKQGFEKRGESLHWTIHGEAAALKELYEAYEHALHRDRKGKHDDREKCNVCQAAWDFENALVMKKMPKYPTDIEEARDQHFKVMNATSSYNKAMLALVCLTLTEVPSWCHSANEMENRSVMWEWMPGHTWCPAPNSTGWNPNLSGIWYLPPGYALVAEVLIELVVLRKFAMEFLHEMKYFRPVNADFHCKANIFCGFLFAIGSVVDTAIFSVHQGPIRWMFFFRTGLLCLLPGVQRMFSRIANREMLREFVSVAVFFIGAVIFFAWIVVTIFKEDHSIAFAKEDGKEIVRVNEGLETLPHTIYTMFLAGMTEGFLDILLPTYTKYRSSILLWLIFLVVTQMLFLNLVIDAFVAAYLKSSEELAEHSAEFAAGGMLRIFKTLSSRDGTVSKEDFQRFAVEIGKSPNMDATPPEAADAIYDHFGKIDRGNFVCACAILQNKIWVTKKDSCIKKGWLYEKVWEPEDNPAFDSFMTWVLFFNLVVVVAQSYYNLNQLQEPYVLGVISDFFTFAYIGEVVIKLSVKSWAEYWSFSANQFDFFTTWLLFATGLPKYLPFTSVKGELAHYANILRLLRLLRVIKQLKQYKSVQFMASTIGKMAEASGDILSLLGVVLFFFSTFSVNFFGGVLVEGDPRLKESDYAKKHWFIFNFNDHIMAFVAWFTQLLGEYEPEWADALYKTASYPEIAWWIFPAFYLIGVAILFEILKAFTIELYLALKEEEDAKKEKVAHAPDHAELAAAAKDEELEEQEENSFLEEATQILLMEDPPLSLHTVQVGSRTFKRRLKLVYKKACEKQETEDASTVGA